MADAIAGLLEANNYDIEKTLAQTGEAISGQLKESIQKFDRVPLSPKTIKRKGFDKQLIETAQMINSVNYRVR